MYIPIPAATYSRRHVVAEIPRYGYPCSHVIRSISQQVTILRSAAGQQGIANDRVTTAKLPHGAEGWFAIPKWQLFGSTYAKAVKAMRAALLKIPGYKIGYPDYSFEDECLSPTAKTLEAFEAIARQQPSCTILLIPAQFGKRYAQISPRSVRTNMPEYEFGLGVFALGAMLLTHPDRLNDSSNVLLPEAVGDIFLREGTNGRKGVPLFSKSNQGTRVTLISSSSSYASCGAATGFLLG